MIVVIREITFLDDGTEAEELLDVYHEWIDEVVINQHLHHHELERVFSQS